MSPGGAGIVRVLDLMGVADEEFGKAGRPRGMWSVLYPPEAMQPLVDDVYRAHCRELLARHKRGESLEPATDAEMLLALSDASLHAPFNNLGGAAYATIARRVLDKDGRGLFEETLRGLPSEPYKGAVDELLAGLQRRLTVAGRCAEPTRATTLEAFA